MKMRRKKVVIMETVRILMKPLIYYIFTSTQ